MAINASSEDFIKTTREWLHGLIEEALDNPDTLEISNAQGFRDVTPPGNMWVEREPDGTRTVTIHWRTK